jgi:hypothetical protein
VQFLFDLTTTHPGSGIGAQLIVGNDSNAQIGVWNNAAGGSWASPTNWSASTLPDGPGVQATFGSVITTPQTVTLDESTTVGNLQFNNENSYTIAQGAGGGSLILDNAGAAAVINVSAGNHSISAPITLASDLNITQNSSGTLTLSGALNDAAGKQINVSGSGTTAIIGSVNLGNATALSASGTSTLRFALTSGSATIGTGVTATVTGGATLELAGSVSALSIGAYRVNVVNNSSAAAGVLISGTNQVIGAIDGAGNTQVNAGSDLTANHIIQNALIIGGAAGSPGLVTIDASDASGNPLGQSSARPSGLILAGSLRSDRPFASDIGSPGLLDGPSSSDSNSTLPSMGSSISAVGIAAVPEPSTILISAFALLSLLGFGISRRRRHSTIR